MNHVSNQEALIGNKTYSVDTVEASCAETRSSVVVHFFNDGEGVAIGIADPRLEGTASIVLSRADTMVLLAQMNKWLSEGSMQA